MKTFDAVELRVRLMTDCGFSPQCSHVSDGLYLCPSKDYLLNRFPTDAQQFLNDLNFQYRKDSSDCDDAVDIALVRGAYVRTLAMFGRRCSAETLGDRKEASYAMGKFVYHDDTRNLDGNDKHAVLFAVTYDEVSDLCEAHFMECVPPVQWIKLSSKEKQSCEEYLI